MHIRKVAFWFIGISVILGLFAPSWLSNHYSMIDFENPAVHKSDGFPLAFCTLFLFIFFIVIKDMHLKSTHMSLIIGSGLGLLSGFLAELYVWGTLDPNAFFIQILMNLMESLMRGTWVAGGIFGLLNRISYILFEVNTAEE